MVGSIVDVALLSECLSIEEIIILLWCGLYACEDIDQASICHGAWGEKDCVYELLRPLLVASLLLLPGTAPWYFLFSCRQVVSHSHYVITITPSKS